MCERAFLWKCVLRCGVHCTMYLSLTISNNSIGNIFDDRKKKIRKNKTHSYTHLGIKPTGATSYCQPEEIKTEKKITSEWKWENIIICVCSLVYGNIQIELTKMQKDGDDVIRCWKLELVFLFIFALFHNNKNADNGEGKNRTTFYFFHLSNEKKRKILPYMEDMLLLQSIWINYILFTQAYRLPQ